MSLFDASGRLVDWNVGFNQEFGDATQVVALGVVAREISNACLLPERALDLSWLTEGVPPPPFEYINGRRRLLVTQSLGINGHIFRVARDMQDDPPLHPALLDESTELLRSSALKISAAVLKRREQENLRLHELALKDELTGVANRRYFNLMLEIESQRCRERELPLSVIFIDIDFFKRYNDVYGHPSGDECLKLIAATLRATLSRPGDIIARYGGEEFTCLLPGADLSDATRQANELERAVRALALEHEKSRVAPVVTISLGVATSTCLNAQEASLLIRVADQQLYEAKAAGRGCVRSVLVHMTPRVK
ncbi:GGDEF domain-containing protein [Halomonas sp. DWK9]|uniref:GGDEF domain-containing protein n=1 Tax=Halomonas sp. DWK9 TaxID=3060155 RepID=UPI00287F55FD|nr:GGDEF domain-containing protein [Halomonas sp. DWK9]